MDGVERTIESLKHLGGGTNDKLNPIRKSRIRGDLACACDVVCVSIDTEDRPLTPDGIREP